MHVVIVQAHQEWVSVRLTVGSSRPQSGRREEKG